MYKVSKALVSAGLVAVLHRIFNTLRWDQLLTDSEQRPPAPAGSGSSGASAGASSSGSGNAGGSSTSSAGGGAGGHGQGHDTTTEYESPETALCVQYLRLVRKEKRREEKKATEKRRKRRKEKRNGRGKRKENDAIRHEATNTRPLRPATLKYFPGKHKSNIVSLRFFGSKARASVVYASAMCLHVYAR
jgi:hypothetical protein